MRIKMLLVLLPLIAGSAWSQKFTPAPPPAPDKSLVYVYREGSMVGAVGRPLIFVNGYFLAEMHNSNYAPIEVPRGAVVISSTYARTNAVNFPETKGPWASLPGCAGLDWRRLAMAPPADIGLCRSGLIDLLGKCGAYTEVLGCQLRGCVWWVTTRFPACNPTLNGFSADALYLLDLAGPLRLALDGGPQRRSQLLIAPLRVQVEAGKTYYVRWSISTSGGSLRVVDSTAGAKEIRKLNLAQESL